MKISARQRQVCKSTVTMNPLQIRSREKLTKTLSLGTRTTSSILGAPEPFVALSQVRGSLAGSAHPIRGWDRAMRLSWSTAPLTQGVVLQLHSQGWVYLPWQTPRGWAFVLPLELWANWNAANPWTCSPEAGSNSVWMTTSILTVLEAQALSDTRFTLLYWARAVVTCWIVKHSL